MDWENLLVYMFSSLFTQNKVVKGLHFTTVVEKDKLNSVCLDAFWGIESCSAWGKITYL